MTGESEKVGLKINQDKTKLLRYRMKCEQRLIKIGDHEFEEIDKCKYYGCNRWRQENRN